MTQQVYFNNPTMQVTRTNIFYGDVKPLLGGQLAPATDSAAYDVGIALARYSQTHPTPALRGKLVNWVDGAANGQGDCIGFLANDNFSPRDFDLVTYPVEYYIYPKVGAQLVYSLLFATPGSDVDDAITQLGGNVELMTDGTQILVI